MPVTGPGPRGVLEVPPCPSCPRSFAPQQRSALLVAAQLCRSPSASNSAPETPGTFTGPFPSATPSCAESFAPQHITSPVPARMAQACLSPTPTEPAPGTPGTDRKSVVEGKNVDLGGR